MILQKYQYVLSLIITSRFRFNNVKATTKFKNFVELKDKYVEFLNKCEFFNLGYDEFVNEVKNNYQIDKCLFFFDPPYLYSHNTSYIFTKDTDNKNAHYDPSQMFIDILSYFNEFTCIFITNKLSIIDHMFNKYALLEYSGKYQRTKNMRIHIIYSN